MKTAKRNPSIAYLFCLPWFIGFICFTLFPIGFMMKNSLTNRKLSGSGSFVGLANYRNLFKSEIFRNSLRVTIFFTLVMVLVTAVWALILALLLNQRVKCKGVFQFCYFLPSVVPTVALAYAFRTIFGRDSGLLNALLHFLSGKNVTINWLMNPGTVYLAVFTVTLFTYNTGQMMLIFRSGLSDVPQELYEAARLDGANAWVKFRRITLPMISPLVLFNIVNGAISALNGSFALLYPLSGESGDPNGMTQVLSLLIYKEAFSNMKVGYACALSMVLFGIAALFGILIFILSKRIVYYET